MYLKIVLLCLFLMRLVRSEDDVYLNETLEQCKNPSEFFSCAKYRALKYVTALTEDVADSNGTSFVNLIKISQYDDGPKLFTSSRQISSDTETSKFVKFVQRQAERFLRHQGLSIALPEGTQIREEDISNEIDEARGKKKKAQVILPLIILLKLFKVKLLVALTLAGVIFIKKVLVIGALLLPSLIHQLKSCKMEHHVPYHAEDFHGHDYGGHEAYGGGYGHAGYGKDWERAYRAYGK